jgi:hypothetical protein
LLIHGIEKQGVKNTPDKVEHEVEGLVVHPGHYTKRKRKYYLEKENNIFKWSQAGWRVIGPAGKEKGIFVIGYIELVPNEQDGIEGDE